MRVVLAFIAREPATAVVFSLLLRRDPFDTPSGGWYSMENILSRGASSAASGQKPMNVGVAQVSLRLPENLSLKGKRQVLKSIIARVRNKFDVAVAEVDNNDDWHLMTIGISAVSNDRRFTNSVLSNVVEFIEKARFEAEMLDYEIEIIDV